MAEQPKPPSGKSPTTEALRAVSRYIDLGVTFVVTIGGGAWLGYWADQRCGTAPWLLLLGAVLGIAVGFYHFFSVVLRQ
jgi:F0F1-type ATP synthase assembly protein I